MRVSKEKIFGIDFSGARKAAEKIWITDSEFDGRGLLIKSCGDAGEFFNLSSNDRESALGSLVEFIRSTPQGLFAIDFPFGIAAALVEEKTWRGFILSFNRRYRTPEEFRKSCLKASRGREIKRQSDSAIKTPFNSFNIRIHRQTFYGISRILNPLLRGDLVSVLPMTEHQANLPIVIEICPASTLKWLGLYFPYKGKLTNHRDSRDRILKSLESQGALKISDRSIRSKIVADTQGDGLDSLVAAYAAYRNVIEGTLTSGEGVTIS